MRRRQLAFQSVRPLERAQRLEGVGIEPQRARCFGQSHHVVAAIGQHVHIAIVGEFSVQRAENPRPEAGAIRREFIMDNGIFHNCIAIGFALKKAIGVADSAAIEAETVQHR